MKHALQVLNYEKRKLINRLYEMQEQNDLDPLPVDRYYDEDFQKVKRKISDVADSIKLIERSTPVTETKPIRPTGWEGK